MEKLLVKIIIKRIIIAKKQKSKSKKCNNKNEKKSDKVCLYSNNLNIEKIFTKDNIEMNNNIKYNNNPFMLLKFQSKNYNKINYLEDLNCNLNIISIKNEEYFKLYINTYEDKKIFFENDKNILKKLCVESVCDRDGCMRTKDNIEFIRHYNNNKYVFQYSM